MELEPPRGHRVYWKRRSAPQPGRSAGGSSPESSPRSGATGRPGCLESAHRLKQCCRSNPAEERMEEKRIEQQVE